MNKTLIYNNILYSGFKIDENGNILNCKTKTIYKKSIRKANGYLYAYLPLGKRGHTKCIRIHKAVAETFIPNPNNLPCVNHIDENRQNCHIANLEWVTSKENFNKHLFNSIIDNVMKYIFFICSIFAVIVVFSICKIGRAHV